MLLMVFRILISCLADPRSSERVFVGLGLVGLGLDLALRRPPLLVYMVFVVDCLVAGSEEV